VKRDATPLYEPFIISNQFDFFDLFCQTSQCLSNHPTLCTETLQDCSTTCTQISHKPTRCKSENSSSYGRSSHFVTTQMCSKGAVHSSTMRATTYKSSMNLSASKHNHQISQLLVDVSKWQKTETNIRCKDRPKIVVFPHSGTLIITVVLFFKSYIIV
jgi:hypothetical protein